MATPKTPGPKPPHMVVDNHLKSQTEEGEISLDLRLPIAKLELIMDSPEMADQKLPRFILDNILKLEEKATLEGMQDGAKAYEILMEFAVRVGERLGASLGESPSSTDSSESTEQPSDSTSDTPSE